MTKYDDDKLVWEIFVIFYIRSRKLDALLRSLWTDDPVQGLTRGFGMEIQWVSSEKAGKKGKKKAVTVEDNFLDSNKNGGDEGTRTLGLLRDRQAL